MDNKRMLWKPAVACAAVVVAGCMTPMGGEMRTQGHKRFNDQVCNANATNCVIEVRIDCDPRPCVGVVDPKVLLVQKGSGSPKIVRWKLTGMGANDYEFKDEKVITGEQAFDCDQPGPHKKEVTCKDTFQGTKTTFEYTLHILKASDGSELTIDPWVVNS
jgi:hypothetical protein